MGGGSGGAGDTAAGVAVDSAGDGDGRVGGLSFGVDFGVDLRRRGVRRGARVGAGVSFGAAGGGLPGRELRAAARGVGPFGATLVLRGVGFEVVFAVGLDAGGSGVEGGGADTPGRVGLAAITFRRLGRVGAALGCLAVEGEVAWRRTVRDFACSGAGVWGPAATARSGGFGVGACGATTGCGAETAARGDAARVRRAGVFPTARRRVGDGAAVVRLRGFMAPVGWRRKPSLNCGQQ